MAELYYDRKAWIIQHALDRVKSLSGEILPAVRRQLGNNLGLFAYALYRVEKALDGYLNLLNQRDVLQQIKRNPPMIVAAATTVESANPVGLIIALFATALASSNSSSESESVLEGTPQMIVLDTDLQALRNTMPAQMAADWVPFGTFDYHLEVKKVAIAYEKAKAAAAASAKVIVAGHVANLKGIYVPKLNQVADDLLLATSLSDVKTMLLDAVHEVSEIIRNTPPPGGPGGCDGVIKNFNDAAKAARDALNMWNRSDQLSHMRWKKANNAFTKAMNAVLQCLGIAPIS